MYAINEDFKCTRVPACTFYEFAYLKKKKFFFILLLSRSKCIWHSWLKFHVIFHIVVFSLASFLFHIKIPLFMWQNQHKKLCLSWYFFFFFKECICRILKVSTIHSTVQKPYLPNFNHPFWCFTCVCWRLWVHKFQFYFLFSGTLCLFDNCVI